MEALDWDTLTLADLLAVASDQAGEGIRLYVADAIQAAATFTDGEDGGRAQPVKSGTASTGAAAGGASTAAGAPGPAR